MLRTYQHVYPFGWLGILAEAPPTSDELVYSRHERGFALFSMRSTSMTRLYLQCDPNADLAEWPDEQDLVRASDTARHRDGWRPAEGTHHPQGRDRHAQFRR